MAKLVDPKAVFTLCNLQYSRTSLQRSPWGQKKVDVVADV